MPNPVVVMGLGNVLLTDDGAGVAALHRLVRTHDFDPWVRLVDGGTLGMALLDYFDPDSVLILIDAVRADAAPGTVVVIEGDDVAEAVGSRLSTHQVGVADLLSAAQHIGRTPRRIVLVGVVPESLALGLGRTPAVEASLPALVEATIVEIEKAGAKVTRANGDAAPRVDVAGALGL